MTEEYRCCNCGVEFKLITAPPYIQCLCNGIEEED
jgi:DNA-directed RNA polymerase subunit RPC12/RpoP